MSQVAALPMPTVGVIVDNDALTFSNRNKHGRETLGKSTQCCSTTGAHIPKITQRDNRNRQTTEYFSGVQWRYYRQANLLTKAQGYLVSAGLETMLVPNHHSS